MKGLNGYQLNKGGYKVHFVTGFCEYYTPDNHMTDRLRCKSRYFTMVILQNTVCTRRNTQVYFGPDILIVLQQLFSYKTQGVPEETMSVF